MFSPARRKLLIHASVLGAAAATRLAFAAQSDAQPTTLRIGYQKSSTLITVLKAQGKLEAAIAPLGIKVSWSEFASGLPLTEALNAEAVDFSADVADTVPIFAQAAHARFVYVAQEAPSPGAQTIIVKRDGALHTLGDLRGKDIAVTKAAGSHYLLLAALARAGIPADGVRIHYLTPADGRAAFEHGSVDAWVTWDPYVASVDQQPDVRILANGEGLAAYQRYYLASTRFAEAQPGVIAVIYDQLRKAGEWVRNAPHDAARLLAPIWGLDAATIERANARRSYQVREVTPSNFGEQQTIADAFLNAHLLPSAVDTARADRWDFAQKRAVPIGT
ncbi:sulfonate transport system substrate-binding protein [Paraburkholderia bannensis]|uniref:Putative aliphatic sulfonates-binding protein n=1 Tax=Paraburkholderia bannensis TaxID=765414 RepID=A0A7W9TXW8_9BURK|nr:MULTISPECIES: aliphatic sulfonate ABC transporter substrate-binding protein [Paraburkholderia]MBB3257239.1 sulfonate transport system substrate-binding protein [Paraburkholderia sp. WP4_3_2]MBB6102365.1 sulfonate transport system substrate-binding protein [Paraburkholderia bannensis]